MKWQSKRPFLILFISKTKQLKVFMNGEDQGIAFDNIRMNDDGYYRLVVSMFVANWSMNNLNICTSKCSNHWFTPSITTHSWCKDIYVYLQRSEKLKKNYNYVWDLLSQGKSLNFFKNKHKTMCKDNLLV